MLQQQPLEQWAASLPLAALVADAVSAVTSTNNVEDPLQAVRDLDETRIKLIQEAVGVGIGILLSEILIREQIKGLQEARANIQMQGADVGSKYQVFQMSTGNVGHFHGGLEGRIGTAATATILNPP